MEKRFCSHCGGPTVLEIPPGDHLERRVCHACNVIHYENPKIVVGCVPEYEGRILICRRAIEPRLGYWTFPAGFMENDETLEAGAARECLEEACARVGIESLLAVVNIPDARQVHVFFRGRLVDGRHAVGPESLETRLVEPSGLPWGEIAFPSTEFALRSFLADRSAGSRVVHLTTLTRRHGEHDHGG